MRHSIHLLIVSFSLMITTACTTATRFYENGRPNYTISPAKDEDLQVSSFSANNYTPSSRSSDFSRLGALIECDNKKKLALIVATINRSASLTHLQTTTQTTPINTKRGTMYYTQSNTTPVTDTFPQHHTYFKCVDKFMSLAGRPELETLGKEIVNPYTGDFKGGILVKNHGSNKSLQENDLIVKANGVRTENTVDLFQVLADAPQKTNLIIYRNKKEMNISMHLEDRTEDLKKNIADDLANACQEVKKESDIIPKICAENTQQAKPVDPEAPTENTKLNKRLKSL